MKNYLNTSTSYYLHYSEQQLFIDICNHLLRGMAIGDVSMRNINSLCKLLNSSTHMYQHCTTDIFSKIYIQSLHAKRVLKVSREIIS